MPQTMKQNCRCHHEHLMHKKKNYFVNYVKLNFFFFFLISNEDLLISKKRHPKYTRSIQGCTYQIQKLHKSSKSKIEEKGWFLHIENQSNMVLKNNSLRSGIERSLSSKHLLFLSSQINHIKQ